MSSFLNCIIVGNPVKKEESEIREEE